MPNKGHKTGCAMTRRDFVMLCIFTPQTALRENAQLSLLGAKNLHSATATLPGFSADVP
jgi:hypothetical protein